MRLRPIIVRTSTTRIEAGREVTRVRIRFFWRPSSASDYLIGCLGHLMQDWKEGDVVKVEHGDESFEWQP